MLHSATACSCQVLLCTQSKDSVSAMLLVHLPDQGATHLARPRSTIQPDNLSGGCKVLQNITSVVSAGVACCATHNGPVVP